jgi:hypothetical protein
MTWNGAGGAGCCVEQGEQGLETGCRWAQSHAFVTAWKILADFAMGLR